MLDKKEAKDLGEFLEQEAKEDTRFQEYVKNNFAWVYFWLIVVTVLAIVK